MAIQNKSRHLELPAGVADAGELPMARPTPLRTCLMSLHNTPFDTTRFAREGIALPPRIARSVPGRRAEFFFGRLAARIALARCGVYGVDVPISDSGAPVWPSRMVGSITHCRGFAAAAVARGDDRRAIGIDLERVHPAHTLDPLRAAVLDATELSLLHASTTMSENLLVTLAFSAKESLYKAAFPTARRFFGFDAARLTAVCPLERRLTLRLADDFCADLTREAAVDVDFELIAPEVVFTCASW